MIQNSTSEPSRVHSSEKARVSGNTGMRIRLPDPLPPLLLDDRVQDAAHPGGRPLDTEQVQRPGMVLGFPERQRNLYACQGC